MPWLQVRPAGPPDRVQAGGIRAVQGDAGARAPQRHLQRLCLHADAPHPGRRRRAGGQWRRRGGRQGGLQGREVRVAEKGGVAEKGAGEC